MQGAARQRRPGLDDLERASDLHRVGPGPAARARIPRLVRRPRHPRHRRPSAARLVPSDAARRPAREPRRGPRRRGVLGEIGLGAVVLAGIGTDDDDSTCRPHGRQAPRPALLRRTRTGGRTWRSPTSAAASSSQPVHALRRRQPGPSPGFTRAAPPERRCRCRPVRRPAPRLGGAAWKPDASGRDGRSSS